MRLKDKVVIITGSATGMGRAGAILFAKEGAKVVVADYDKEKGMQTVADIKAAGNEASFFEIDLSDIPRLKDMVDFTVATYGKLDVLWNHGGIPGPTGIENISEEAYDKLMDITVKAPIFATKWAIPEIRKQGKGSILFTGSTSGLKASPTAPCYGAAKGAIVNLTRCLAASLGPENIRVNLVSPGPTASPMWDEFVQRKDQTLTPEQIANANKGAVAGVPLGRMQQPEELAYAALFLVSDEASYVNGAILTSDGGQSVK